MYELAGGVAPQFLRELLCGAATALLDLDRRPDRVRGGLEAPGVVHRRVPPVGVGWGVVAVPGLGVNLKFCAVVALHAYSWMAG